MSSFVVVGGGATAPDWYDWIRESGHPVIAPSTMLLPLQRAGVKVDVCCIGDGSVLMPLHFIDADKSGELVYCENVRPEIPLEWQGKKKLFKSERAWSTVLMICVYEAVQRGATTIHLVGADFCYTKGLSHAPGVATAYDISRYEGWEAINGYGEKIKTERGLIHYRGELDLYVFELRGRVKFIKYGREGLPTIGAKWSSSETVRTERCEGSAGG